MDYGEGNYCNIVATEVLVFYAVGIKEPWKHAIAYFFINKLNSTKLKELVEVAIDKLYSIGVHVSINILTFLFCLNLNFFFAFLKINLK